MLLYDISQKENKFTECVICKLRISQNIGSLTPGIKTRGMAAWQWRGDKVHLQQQRCVLNPEHYYVTINTRKYTPSSKKYPCLTLSQAISQLFNQSNNQLVIHQSIYQSDNLVSQSVSQSVIETVSQLSLNQSNSQEPKQLRIIQLVSYLHVSVFQLLSQSASHTVSQSTPQVFCQFFYQPCSQIKS